jgi:hypothetical protein
MEEPINRRNARARVVAVLVILAFIFVAGGSIFSAGDTQTASEGGCIMGMNPQGTIITDPGCMARAEAEGTQLYELALVVFLLAVVIGLAPIISKEMKSHG